MGAPLPRLGVDEFDARLKSLLPPDVPPLTAGSVAALFAHYDVLRQWNPRLSLVGPGTANEVLARHYAESLAGLSLMDDRVSTMVDIGSGAGFPGFVLAAARPRVATTLVEARQRKWSFLRTAIRQARVAMSAIDGERCALSCTALNARIARPLPGGVPDAIDLVTSRAVAMTDELLEAFLERDASVQFLLWRGSDRAEQPTMIEIRAEKALPGTRHRRIVLAEGRCPRRNTKD